MQVHAGHREQWLMKQGGRGEEATAGLLNHSAIATRCPDPLHTVLSASPEWLLHIMQTLETDLFPEPFLH